MLLEPCSSLWHPYFQVRPASSMPRGVTREVQTEPEHAGASSPIACQALTARAVTEPLAPAWFPDVAIGPSSPKPRVVAVVAHAKPDSRRRFPADGAVGLCDHQRPSTNSDMSLKMTNEETTHTGGHLLRRPRYR